MLTQRLGRDPASLKFFPCIVPIIGRTEEEAQAKYEKAKSHAHVLGGLAQVCNSCYSIRGFHF